MIIFHNGSDNLHQILSNWLLLKTFIFTVSEIVRRLKGMGSFSQVRYLSLLHGVKTTGTGLVWRTRPCGTEGTRHLKNPSFQYLTSLSDEAATIAKSYVEEKSIVQDLLQFQRRSN